MEWQPELIAELKSIDGFDDSIAEELQRRASDVLLTQELVSASDEDELAEENLLHVEGVTADLAQKLNSHGIVTRDDLAELSVDELYDKVRNATAA